jgi:hypothetical protein
VEADKPKNGDEGAVALLKWILAALLLVNGVGLALAMFSPGVDEGLLEGSGLYYAAGLLCALLGAGCWSISYSSMPRGGSNDGSSDPAVASGAMAIMLWVASLTTFVVGCEQVSWVPERKAMHQASAPARVPAAQVMVVAPQTVRR